MDITTPAPMGAQASLLANSQVRKPPDSSKIEAAPDTGRARADMHNTKHHNGDYHKRDQTTPLSADVEVQPDTLAGPPPSFQVNILELDQMLLQKLARIETERARDQQSDRVSLAPRDERAPEQPGKAEAFATARY